MKSVSIRKEDVLRLFDAMPCVNLRQLASHLRVDVASTVLARTLAALERAGEIRRIGEGRHAAFVLARFGTV